jgi:hypothetical protein
VNVGGTGLVLLAGVEPAPVCVDGVCAPVVGPDEPSDLPPAS